MSIAAIYAPQLEHLLKGAVPPAAPAAAAAPSSGGGFFSKARSFVTGGGASTAASSNAAATSPVHQGQPKPRDEAALALVSDLLTAVSTLYHELDEIEAADKETTRPKNAANKQKAASAAPPAAAAPDDAFSMFATAAAPPTAAPSGTSLPRAGLSAGPAAEGGGGSKSSFFMEKEKEERAFVQALPGLIEQLCCLASGASSSSLSPQFQSPSSATATAASEKPVPGPLCGLSTAAICYAITVLSSLAVQHGAVVSKAVEAVGDALKDSVRTGDRRNIAGASRAGAALIIGADPSIFDGMNSPFVEGFADAFYFDVAQVNHSNVHRRDGTSVVDLVQSIFAKRRGLQGANNAAVAGPNQGRGSMRTIASSLMDVAIPAFKVLTTKPRDVGAKCALVELLGECLVTLYCPVLPAQSTAPAHDGRRGDAPRRHDDGSIDSEENDKIRELYRIFDVVVSADDRKSTRSASIGQPSQSSGMDGSVLSLPPMPLSAVKPLLKVLTDPQLPPDSPARECAASAIARLFSPQFFCAASSKVSKLSTEPTHARFEMENSAFGFGATPGAVADQGHHILRNASCMVAPPLLPDDVVKACRAAAISILAQTVSHAASPKAFGSATPIGNLPPGGDAFVSVFTGSLATSLGPFLALFVPLPQLVKKIVQEAIVCAPYAQASLDPHRTSSATKPAATVTGGMYSTSLRALGAATIAAHMASPFSGGGAVFLSVWHVCSSEAIHQSFQHSTSSGGGGFLGSWGIGGGKSGAAQAALATPSFTTGHAEASGASTALLLALQVVTDAAHVYAAHYCRDEEERSFFMQWLLHVAQHPLDDAGGKTARSSESAQQTTKTARERFLEKEREEARKAAAEGDDSASALEASARSEPAPSTASPKASSVSKAPGEKSHLVGQDGKVTLPPLSKGMLDAAATAASQQFPLAHFPKVLEASHAAAIAAVCGVNYGSTDGASHFVTALFGAGGELAEAAKATWRGRSRENNNATKLQVLDDDDEEAASKSDAIATELAGNVWAVPAPSLFEILAGNHGAAAVLGGAQSAVAGFASQFTTTSYVECLALVAVTALSSVLAVSSSLHRKVIDHVANASCGFLLKHLSASEPTLQAATASSSSHPQQGGGGGGASAQSAASPGGSQSTLSSTPVGTEAPTPNGGGAVVVGAGAHHVDPAHGSVAGASVAKKAQLPLLSSSAIVAASRLAAVTAPFVASSLSALVATAEGSNNPVLLAQAALVLGPAASLPSYVDATSSGSVSNSTELSTTFAVLAEALAKHAGAPSPAPELALEFHGGGSSSPLHGSPFYETIAPFGPALLRAAASWSTKLTCEVGQQHQRTASGASDVGSFVMANAAAAAVAPPLACAFIIARVALTSHLLQKAKHEAQSVQTARAERSALAAFVEQLQQHSKTTTSVHPQSALGALDGSIDNSGRPGHINGATATTPSSTSAPTIVLDQTSLATIADAVAVALANHATFPAVAVRAACEVAPLLRHCGARLHFSLSTPADVSARASVGPTLVSPPSAAVTLGTMQFQQGACHNAASGVAIAPQPPAMHAQQLSLASPTVAAAFSDLRAYIASVVLPNPSSSGEVSSSGAMAGTWDGCNDFDPLFKHHRQAQPQRKLLTVSDRTSGAVDRVSSPKRYNTACPLAFGTEDALPWLPHAAVLALPSDLASKAAASEEHQREIAAWESWKAALIQLLSIDRDHDNNSASVATHDQKDAELLAKVKGLLRTADLTRSPASPTDLKSSADALERLCRGTAADPESALGEPSTVVPPSQSQQLDVVSSDGHFSSLLGATESGAESSPSSVQQRALQSAVAVIARMFAMGDAALLADAFDPTGASRSRHASSSSSTAATIAIPGSLGASTSDHPHDSATPTPKASSGDKPGASYAARRQCLMKVFDILYESDGAASTKASTAVSATGPSSAVPSACAAHVLPMSMAERRRKTVHWNVTVLLHKIVDECAAVRREVLRGHAHYAAFAAASSPPPSAHNGSASESSDKSTAALEKAVQIAGLTTTMSTATSDALSMDPNAATALFQESARLSELIATLRKQLTAVFLPSIYPAVRHVAASALARLPEIPGASAEATSLATLTSGAISGTGVAPATKHGVALALALWASAQNNARGAAVHRRALFFNLTGQHVAQAALSALQKEIATAQHHGDAAAAAADADPFGFDTVLPAQVVTAPPLAPLAPPSPTSSSFAPLVFSYSANALRGTTQDVASAAGGDEHSKAAAAAQIRAATAVALSAESKQVTASETSLACRFKIAGVSATIAAAPPPSVSASAVGGAVDEQWSVAVSKSLAGLTSSPALAPKPTSSHRCVSSAVSDALHRLCTSSTSSSVGLRSGGGGGGAGDKASPSTSGALLAVTLDQLWLQRSVPLNGASLRTIDEVALSRIVSMLSSVKTSASGNCMGAVDLHTVDSNAFARLHCTTDLLLSIFAGTAVPPAGGKRLPTAPPGSAAASSGLLPATVASALIEVTATPADSRRGGAATETGPAVGAKTYDDDEGGGVAALGLAAAAKNRRGDSASRTTATAEQGNGSANSFGFDTYLAMADSFITTSSSAGPTPQQQRPGSVNVGAGAADDAFAAFVASGPAVAAPKPPAQKSSAASPVSALEAIEKSSVSVPIEVSTSGPLRGIACEGLVAVVESIRASLTTLLSSRNRGHDQNTSQDIETKIAALLVLVEKIGAAFRSMLQRGIGSAHPSVVASVLQSVARIINPSSVKGAPTSVPTRPLRRSDNAVMNGEEEKAASRMIRRVLMSSSCLRPVLVHAATTALSLSAEHPGIVSVERCVLPFLRSILPRAGGGLDQDRHDVVLHDADVAHIVRAAAAAEAALSHSPYSPSYLSFVIGAVSSSPFATTFEGVDSIAEIHGAAPPRPSSTETIAERASGKKLGPHSIYHPIGSQPWCNSENTAGRSKTGGSRGKEGGAKWIMETVVPSIPQTNAKTRAEDHSGLLSKFSKEAAAAIAPNADRKTEETVPYSSAVVVEYLRLRAVQDSVRGVWDDATALQDTSAFPAVPADSDTTEHVDAIVAAVMDEQKRGSHFDLAFVAHVLLAVYSDTVVAQHRQASLSQQRQASHARARSQSPTPGSTIPGSPSGGSLQSNNTSFGRRPNGGCLPTVTTLSRRKARLLSDPAMLGVVVSVALTLSFGHPRRGGCHNGNGVRQTNGQKNGIGTDSDNDDMMVMDTMKSALFVAGVIRHVRPLFDEGARLCIEATIHRLITETAKTNAAEAVSNRIGLSAIAGALSCGVDSSTGASAVLRTLCDGQQANAQKRAVSMFPLQATVTLNLASTLSDVVRACQVTLPATANRSHGTALVTVDLARHVAAALARSTEGSSAEQSRALGDGELLSQFLSGVAPLGDAAVTAPSPLLVIAGLFSLAPGHAVKPGASVSPSLSAVFVSALSAVLFDTHHQMEPSKHNVKNTDGGGESEETVQRASLITELAASCARSNAGLAYLGALLLRILAIAPTLRSADGSSASAVVAKAILRLAATAAADQDATSQTNEEQAIGANGQGTLEGWMTVEERKQWRVTAVLTLVAMVANAAEKPCRDLIPPVVARIAAIAPSEARAAVAQLPPELSTAMREASVAKPPQQPTSTPTAPPPAVAQPTAQVKPTSQPGAPSPAGGGLGFSAAAFALPTTEPKPKPQKPTLAFSAAAFQ